MDIKNLKKTSSTLADICGSAKSFRVKVFNRYQKIFTVIKNNLLKKFYVDFDLTEMSDKISIFQFRINYNIKFIQKVLEKDKGAEFIYAKYYDQIIKIIPEYFPVSIIERGVFNVIKFLSKSETDKILTNLPEDMSKSSLTNYFNIEVRGIIREHLKHLDLAGIERLIFFNNLTSKLKKYLIIDGTTFTVNLTDKVLVAIENIVCHHLILYCVQMTKSDFLKSELQDIAEKNIRENIRSASDYDFKFNYVLTKTQITKAYLVYYGFPPRPSEVVPVPLNYEVPELGSIASIAVSLGILDLIREIKSSDFANEFLPKSVLRAAFQCYSIDVFNELATCPINVADIVYHVIYSGRTAIINILIEYQKDALRAIHEDDMFRLIQVCIEKHDHDMLVKLIQLFDLKSLKMHDEEDYSLLSHAVLNFNHFALTILKKHIPDTLDGFGDTAYSQAVKIANTKAQEILVETESVMAGAG